MHIAQIGTGRVGRPSAFAIISTGLVDTITLCDTKPGLASAFAEELLHVSASLNLDIKINSCEKNEDIDGADIILISAGEPRTPGIKMSRRDLAIINGKIVSHIAESTTTNNKGAKYVVITNPVDAMAMVCKNYSRAEFVISTGTNIESLRFRSRLSKMLGVSISEISGWVGGEHGDAAIILWSTVKINGCPFDEYEHGRLQTQKLKNEMELYMKNISKVIIDNIGGTEYGPASSFRDIIKAIIKDTREFVSIATPTKFKDIPEPVSVGIPIQLGKSIGRSLYPALLKEEQKGILEAAKAIYKTYKKAGEEE